MQVIAGTGLTLEPQTVAHAEEMFLVLSDPAIYEYENDPPPSVEWLRARFARLESRRSSDDREQWLNWVIRLPSSGLVGYVQATVRPGGRAAIAYVLSSAYWGRGLASEAVRAMIAELVKSYEVHTLAAVFKQENHRSMRLLERLGFKPASPAEHVKRQVETGERLMELEIRGPSCPSGTSSTFVAADGDGYELLMGRWSRRLAMPFLDFVGTANSERILDVGCGTGHLSFALADRSDVTEVRGVDLAAVYVEHARQHNRDPRIVFEVADACALAFADRSFDRVLSLLVLHFVPQPERAIAEMRRVAKPGAVVGAAVWDARGGFVANRMFFDTAAALDPNANERRARSYTRPMTRPGELAAAWTAAGFTDVTETTLGIRMEYANFADYWAPYAGKDGPGAEYVTTLGEAERSRLKETVRAAYLDGEADGARSYAALAWAVRGIAP